MIAMSESVPATDTIAPLHEMHWAFPALNSVQMNVVVEVPTVAPLVIDTILGLRRLLLLGKIASSQTWKHKISIL